LATAWEWLEWTTVNCRRQAELRGLDEEEMEGREKSRHLGGKIDFGAGVWLKQ
jgi:hypothetical protein